MSVLPMPPFGPSTQISSPAWCLVSRALVPVPAGHRLLDREAQLERRLADLVGDHDVVRPGLEDRGA